jgi:hypothetical protein
MRWPRHTLQRACPLHLACSQACETAQRNLLPAWMQTYFSVAASVVDHLHTELRMFGWCMASPAAAWHGPNIWTRAGMQQWTRNMPVPQPSLAE